MLTHVSDRLVITSSVRGIVCSGCARADRTVADARSKSRAINLRVVLQAATTTKTSNSKKKNDISLSICSSSVMLSLASSLGVRLLFERGSLFTHCAHICCEICTEKSFCIAEQFFFLKIFLNIYIPSWKVWNMEQFAIQNGSHRRARFCKRSAIR